MDNERDKIIQADEITNLKIDLATKSIEEIFDIPAIAESNKTTYTEPKYNGCTVTWNQESI